EGNGWIAYYDEYTRRRYGAIRSQDLKQWTPVQGLSFPRGVRHGTAFEVPADVAAGLSRHSTEAAVERWRLTPAGIEWPAEQVAAGPNPHDDHIEMSGLRVSAIVEYGVDVNRRLTLWRRVVWPMLRTIPNDTH